VAEAFFDDLEVGAAGEEPGGVGVSEGVHLDVDVEAGSSQRWFEDRLAEPASGDVSVGRPGPGATRLVVSGRPSLCSVVGVGAPTPRASAPARGGAAETAVAVTTSAGVWLSEAARLVRRRELRRTPGWVMVASL
jgi:hypothetical protein